MSSPYYESFGEDYEITDDENESGITVSRRKYNTRWNRDTRSWECDCNTYRMISRCKHVYRLRREETAEVNEDYL